MTRNVSSSFGVGISIGGDVISSSDHAMYISGKINGYSSGIIIEGGV